MRLSRKIVSFAALALLLGPLALPTVAFADTRDDRCNGSSKQDDECKDSRKGFQAKFF